MERNRVDTFTEIYTLAELQDIFELRNQEINGETLDLMEEYDRFLIKANQDKEHIPERFRNGGFGSK